MSDPTREELAYAAGIIDGEGSLGITEIKVNERDRRRSPTIRGYVAVQMADAIVPAWLSETFGGSFQSYLPRKPGQRGSSRWCLFGATAAEFCALIRDHLRVKVPQADLLISYYADPRFVFKQRQGIPEQEITERREFVHRAQALNRGGQ